MNYMPKSTLIEINNVCNYNCRHCYAQANNDETELSLATVKDILEQLACMGIKTVAFSGGEPLLHPDVLAMLKYAKACKFNVVLDTNGSLLTHEVAYKLKQLNVDLVNVSLHGFFDYEHEYLTNEKGSFKQVLGTLELLSKEEVPVGINVALNPKNSLNAHKILLIAVSYNVKSISFFRVFETGRAKKNSTLQLSMEEHQKIFFNIKSMVSRIGYPSIELYTELPYIYKSLESERVYACGIAMESFVISHKGEVFLCNALRSQDLVCGSIYNSKILDIWSTSDIFCKIREIRSNQEKFVGNCAICDYYNICIGGCRACSYNIYGDFIHSDDKCWLLKGKK